MTKLTERAFVRAAETFTDNSRILLDLIAKHPNGIASEDLIRRFGRKTKTDYRGYGGCLGGIGRKISETLGAAGWDWSPIIKVEIEDGEKVIYPGPVLLRAIDKGAIAL